MVCFPVHQVGWPWIGQNMVVMGNWRFWQLLATFCRWPFFRDRASGHGMLFDQQTRDRSPACRFLGIYVRLEVLNGYVI